MGNKTKLQMRTDLALDLKITIDTELSKAELNRCIDRAFSDMSRFLPDEKIYEDSLQFSVTGESVTFPVDTSTTRIVDGQTLNGVSAGATVTIANQPDVARPLTMTVTDANGSITRMSVIVKGTDKDDEAIQEVFHHVAWLAPVVGKKYFKTVNEVEVDQVTGNGTDDELNIGVGAYTDVWVALANSPIKWTSESATDTDSNNIVRNTDFYIDYANGRVKAIDGGDIVAGETSTFAYTKSQIGISLDGLPGLIRVQRVEYPVGKIPQTFVTGDVFGKYYVVTGEAEGGEQEPLAENKQYRIYYDAEHHSPTEFAPGTEPGFLTGTVELAAGAYGLYILALKNEHQGATDLGLARTALGNATGTHSALATALTDLKKYLDNNSTNDAASSLGSANGDHSAFAVALTNLIKYLNNNSEADAVGILKDITDDLSELRTKIITAEDLVNTLVDGVITDLGNANDARANYMGTTNYVDGGTAPDIKKYLDDGDALLNTVPVGGEGQDVPRAYADYARATKDALVATHEQDRAFYQQNATARTNGAMAAASEVAQRLSMLRSYIEEAAGYVSISDTFGIEAGHRSAGINAYLRQAESYIALSNTFARQADNLLTQINSYLQQASHYAEAAAGDMSLADRFREEADNRRAEVFSIWRDRKQYIGDFTANAMRQYPRYD